MQRKAPLRARNTLDNRLWARLKALEGYRFRRKLPFRTFTLDFVEHDAGPARARGPVRGAATGTSAIADVRPVGAGPQPLPACTDAAPSIGVAEPLLQVCIVVPRALPVRNDTDVQQGPNVFNREPRRVGALRIGLEAAKRPDRLGPLLGV